MIILHSSFFIFQRHTILHLNTQALKVSLIAFRWIRTRVRYNFRTCFESLFEKLQIARLLSFVGNGSDTVHCNRRPAGPGTLPLS